MSDNSYLNSYDEIVAITQNTINSQLLQLCPEDNSGPILITWSTQLNPTAEPGSPQAWPALIVDSMAPPTVSVKLPDGSLNPSQMDMTLHLTSGSLQYFDLYGQEQTEPVVNWDVNFTVLLNQMTISSEEDLDKFNSPQPVIDQVTGYLNSADFTVASLFCDFENSNFTSTTITMSGDNLDPTSQVFLTAEALISGYLQMIQGTGNPFILGYPVASTDPGTTSPGIPAFAPTASQFSTNPYHYSGDDDGSMDGLSTLNFLLMTEQNALPDYATNDAFAFNWVDETTVQGVMAIRADLFQQGYIVDLILPHLRTSLGIPSSINWVYNGYADSWSINYNDQPYENDNGGKGEIIGKDSGMLNIYEQLTNQTSCTLTVSEGPEIVLTGSGTFYSKADIYEYPIGIKTHMMWSSAQMDFDFTISLGAGSEADNGTITTTFTISNSGIVYDEWKNVIVEIADWISSWFTDTNEEFEASITNSITNLENANYDQLDSDLKSALNSLSSQVILPNGSVYFYDSMVFDDQKNVRMNVTYIND